MAATRGGFVTFPAAAGGAFMLWLAMTLGAPAADDKPYVMKIALATLDDALHQYAKNYAARIGKDSGGRVKAEIYPAS
jgi:TRAP-type C4-dicarboxylate transport system substrate-binding protein